MSKIFYDHLIVMSDLEITLSTYSLDPQDKAEIHHLVEESIHHRVVSLILDHLPRKHHKKFLDLFHDKPHSPEVLDFLREKTFNINIEDLIRKEVALFEGELVEDIRKSKPLSKKVLKLKKR